MALTVISTVIRHCISGHIESPSIDIQEKMCTVIADSLHQQLGILPERIEMYQKGLVSTLPPGWTVLKLAQDLFSNGSSIDSAALINAIEILVDGTKAWPVVRAQFETQQSNLATDLANLLLVAQFDPTSLGVFKDDQGKFIIF